MSSRGPVIATVMPKPCLKQAAQAHHAQKHAHFPPPSEEARRYSGIEYDRTPITIATNELALPARGCPGRTFDDLDAHKYRHHLKKLRCPKEQFAQNNALSNLIAIPSETAKFGRLSLTDLSALPPLVHADTSDSEEDEIGRLREGEALRQYPNPLLLPAGSKGETGIVTKTEPRRLRKAHTRGGTASRAVRESTGETTPTSIFASCPGSNSCLGGF